MSTVVIGANYGDEGKGLITDFEARRVGADLVVRFNGGAQAGHTVVDGNRRHVFGHVSAGTFAGAATMLSSKFIVNPLALEKELQVLGDAKPDVINVMRTARVTTIYDMVINSIVELSRGTQRHGSCGMGINETVTRHEKFPLTVYDIERGGHWLVQNIQKIRELWVPYRLAGLGFDVNNLDSRFTPYKDVLASTDYFGMARAMYEQSQPLTCNPTKLHGSFVFEGAQGLALDEFLGTFPHVTRSITGLPYAILAAAELGVKVLNPIYVTRSYLTRHGAGPLAADHEELEHNPEDTTNVPNPWQGTLRYAPLNVEQLSHFISADLARGHAVAQAMGVTIGKPGLAVTCLDQFTGKIKIISSAGIARSVEIEDLPGTVIRMLKEKFNIELSHVSFGPEAKHVQRVGHYNLDQF